MNNIKNLIKLKKKINNFLRVGKLYGVLKKFKRCLKETCGKFREIKKKMGDKFEGRYMVEFLKTNLQRLKKI